MTRPASKRMAILPLLLSLAAFAGPCPAAERGDPGTRRYQVRLVGEPEELPGDVRDLLQATSTLVQLQENPPPSIIGLRNRADTDDGRLEEALRSLGYYAGQVDIRVDPGAELAKVVIAVETGPRYTISSVATIGAGDQPVPSFPAERIGITPGQAAVAADVVNGETRLLGLLGDRGYAYAQITDRKVIVDHARRTMEVTYVVDPGPLVRLGTVTFRGLERLHAPEAMRQVPWQPGETLYTPQKLEDFRTALSELGVFSSIRVRLADAAGPDGVSPVTVELRERDPRYISLGINYSTADGIGAKATWGHRNLLGNAEQLDLTASVSGIARSGTSFGRIDYKVDARFRKPDFLSRNQFLLLGADLLSESPDAYDRRAAIATAAVERHFTPRLIGSAGLSSERSRVVERNGRRTDNTLFGIPVTLAWDRSDDILNPTRGFRLSGGVTPYLATFGGSDRFTVGRVGGSLYVPLSGDGHTVWASRAQMGAIVGASAATIPADKRFYAGGGGSVRGYGYQQIGPKDATGQPIGGRSLIEVSTELRFRITENIGLVPFIDGGNVYRSEYPKLGQGLRWGAGIGARYHTGFGPFRIDFGFPIARRSGESAWQLYLSLGQAF